MMAKTSMHDIEKLYRQCGAILEGSPAIRRDVNQGTLNNRLNTNFSNVYGRCGINSVSGSTITKNAINGRESCPLY